MQWYYADQGQQKGPVDEAALDELVSAGAVRDNTLVWREGMAEWQPHASVRGSRVATAVPPAIDQAAYCSECGLPFPAAELVALGQARVCASCKPIYLQKIREGTAQPVGARRFGGFWARFVARIIDAVIINVAMLAVRIPLGVSTFTPFNGNSAAGIGTAVFVTLISIVAAACYEIFMVAGSGATLGKMALGLKVIRSDGSNLSLGRSTGRYFGLIVSYLTLAIGYIIAAFDSEKRALHDRICDTRVIYSK